MATFEIATDKDINEFSEQLGMLIWNIAILHSPYDTGNLRSAISLRTNRPKNISIMYNAFNAPYLHFLEQGEGLIKKHKGFISNDTMLDVIRQTMSYFITGRVPFSTIPTITLRESRWGALFYEKKLLRQMGKSNSNITASDRRKLSNIYANKVRGTNQQTSRIGQQPRLIRNFSRSQNAIT